MTKKEYYNDINNLPHWSGSSPPPHPPSPPLTCDPERGKWLVKTEN